MKACLNALRIVLIVLALAARGTVLADEPAAKGVRTFELLVVGPDGKPAAEAKVELRTSPLPAEEQIKQGKLIRKAQYATFVETDAEGRIVLELTKPTKNFSLYIITPGYGPYTARWSTDTDSQPLPERFTAELEAGWSVGGIVVDDAGKPVEGVQVSPSIEFKKRPGDESQLAIGNTVKTNAEGKWRFGSVPASLAEVHVTLTHPSFKPESRSLKRSEFGLELKESPRSKIALNRGLTVTGVITDEAGKPIEGALVRTKYLNDSREAKTDDKGVYHLSGCEPRLAKIVVSAKGKATDMKQVRLEEEMDPVDFQMQPGGTVRIRVLDQQGNAIPKARIFFQWWRGGFAYWEFDHVSQYADANGVWEWKEAPLDEFRADICPTNGMQMGRQSLVARPEEYVFRTPPALVISGNVTDAETGQPIKKFRVVPGIRSSDTHMNWARGETYAASNGKYSVRRVHDYYAYLLRIEADGYQPAVSRDIQSDEGTITIDFQLQKGKDVAATVLTPSGEPAAKARIALGVAGSQISVKNGQLDEGSTYCARQTADEQGRFRFPPQDDAFQLVIMHPAGYAHVADAPDKTPEVIKLEPWARVEGTFRAGANPVANVKIEIDSTAMHTYGDDIPHIYNAHEATTGEDGRFVFPRVIPGPARISRSILLLVEQGAVDITSSCRIAADFTAGETTRLDLGGTGRAVIARLQPPRGFQGNVDWRFAIIDASVHVAFPPQPADPPIPAEIAKNPAERATWMQKWQQTPPGLAGVASDRRDAPAAQRCQTLLRGDGRQRRHVPHRRHA